MQANETVMRRAISSTIFWQIIVGAALLALWQYIGYMPGTQWISQPSLIAERLVRWMSGGEFYYHLLITMTEIAVGIVIGVPFGALFGLWLGRNRVLATILRPGIVAVYAIPVVALVPLLILWFGFGMQPKILAIIKAVFFISFFNAFAGVQQVSQDVVTSLRLIGANAREEFWHVIVPSSMAWVFAGIKISLPYAFVAAVSGEMIAARHGLGVLVSQAAAQFDMTGMYASLFVLMLVGAVISGVAQKIEDRLLRWRNATG